METKDRTQASYNLVDISEQTRIALEKCKETKEQRIEDIFLEGNLAKVTKRKETKTYYRPKELCCAKCEYSIDMANSSEMFCLVDDDIKSGRDKEQCPFYKKEQNNGK